MYTEVSESCTSSDCLHELKVDLQMVRCGLCCMTHAARVKLKSCLLIWQSYYHHPLRSVYHTLQPMNHLGFSCKFVLWFYQP